MNTSVSTLPLDCPIRFSLTFQIWDIDIKTQASGICGRLARYVYLSFQQTLEANLKNKGYLLGYG